MDLQAGSSLILPKPTKWLLPQALFPLKELQEVSSCRAAHPCGWLKQLMPCPGGVTPGTPPCSHGAAPANPRSASVGLSCDGVTLRKHWLSRAPFVPMRVTGVDGGDLALLSQSMRVVSVKGAGALGDATGAFTDQGLFANTFFLFPRDRYARNISKNVHVASSGLSKCWFSSCSHWHAGRQRGAMEESSNTVMSGREQRQELDPGLLISRLVPASNPGLLAGSWVHASTQAGAVSQSGQCFTDH